MRRSFILASLLIAGLVVLTGCDPAPSTKLAPEVKMPDVDKMTAAQMRGGSGSGVPKASP